MKIRSLSSLLGGLLVLVSALFLASCGGGGAQGNPQTAGALAISPSDGTIYAGVPFTFQISGGRKPNQLSASEPGLIDLPSQTDSNSLTVVAANPGVVDTGLPPGALPVRSVNITVRSGDGQSVVAAMKVGQNFLLGYGISIAPITCPLSLSSSTGVEACAGGQSTIKFSATFNGNLQGDRAFELQAMKGQFQFVYPQGGVAGNTLSTTSDHTGEVTAIIQMAGNAPTQIAVLRVVDSATGVYADNAFVITGSGTPGQLTLVPTSVTFTGNLTTDCGVGSAQVLAFDGTPPFMALSTLPGIVVTPASSTTSPGQFTVTVVGNTPPCAQGTVVVTDSTGARGSVDVTSNAGSGTAPPPAFTLAPTSLTITCAQTASVVAVGGSGTYSASSADPNITVSVSGSVISITRAGVLPAIGANTTSTVTVTDGSTTASVSVTNPSACS